MISKSQEETEVSWRLEEWALEAGVSRISWRTACRVPHSFAFFANEWVLCGAADPKPLDRTSFDFQRHS